MSTLSSILGAGMRLTVCSPATCLVQGNRGVHSTPVSQGWQRTERYPMFDPNKSNLKIRKKKHGEDAWPRTKWGKRLTQVSRS